jgi:hypothetical protein
MPLRFRCLRNRAPGCEEMEPATAASHGGLRSGPRSTASSRPRAERGIRARLPRSRRRARPRTPATNGAISVRDQARRGGAGAKAAARPGEAARAARRSRGNKRAGTHNAGPGRDPRAAPRSRGTRAHATPATTARIVRAGATGTARPGKPRARRKRPRVNVVNPRRP